MTNTDKVIVFMFFFVMLILMQVLTGTVIEQQETILKQNARIVELTAFMNNQRNVDQNQQQQLNNHAEAIEICLTTP